MPISRNAGFDSDCLMNEEKAESNTTVQVTMSLIPHLVICIMMHYNACDVSCVISISYATSVQ